MGNFKFRFSFAVILFISLFIPKSLEEQAIVNASTYDSLEIDTSLLKDGDIIFRRGISFVSNLVLENDENSPYSHVGIISFFKGNPFVIHAVPDESEDGLDYIRKDSLDLFLRKDRASAYSVMRYSNSIISEKASAFSKLYYNKKLLFDDDFSLQDTTKLYCTELVWRAFQKAGVELTENKFDTLTIPLGNNPYLLPGTILNSPNIIQVTKTSIYQ